MLTVQKLLIYLIIDMLSHITVLDDLWLLNFHLKVSSIRFLNEKEEKLHKITFLPSQKKTVFLLKCKGRLLFLEHRPVSFLCLCLVNAQVHIPGFVDYLVSTATTQFLRPKREAALDSV